MKIVPANNGHKRLKLVCGSNTSYLDDGWGIGEKTPFTLADIRVSPCNTVNPNIGAGELAEALNRVLPFTAKTDSRPVLQCIKVEAKEGKLRLVSADGFRLAVVTLDFEGEGEALINREDLRGIPNALRHAKRARLSFEKGGDTLEGVRLILETELIRYSWQGVDGSFPDYEKLIPTDFKGTVSFDTWEASKAVASLKALSDNPKAYPIDIATGDGKVKFADTLNRGEAEIAADIQGDNIGIRLDGAYLLDALKVCNGMVDLSITSPTSPMLFTVDGYRLVVMPMFAGSDKAKAEAEGEAKAEAVTTVDVVDQAEVVADAVAEAPKPETKAERKAKRKVEREAKDKAEAAQHSAEREAEAVTA